jgi:hypothetical protein
LGSVELAVDFFKKHGIEPGHHIVIKGKGSRLRVIARASESLGSCEIAVCPRLAVYLDLKEGVMVDLAHRITIGDDNYAGIDVFAEILNRPCNHLQEVMHMDLDRFTGLTVKGVLDHMVRYGEGPDGNSLVVAPNPDGYGIPREGLCEDLSLGVKEWSPADANGNVRLFNPEGADDQDD